MKTAKLAVPYPFLGSPQGDQELQAVAEVLQTSDALAGGPARDRFEQELRSYLDVGLAATTPSCTYALWTATQLLDLRPGDEVIANPLTYQASLAPLLGRGLTVRFADIDPVTLEVDPDHVAQLAGRRTKAIYVTHYGGNPVDMPALMSIADEVGATVVEDAAHAVGAEIAGQAAGTFGIGCFSFGSSKNITTLGQGGAIVVRDPSAQWRTTIEQLLSVEPLCRFEDLPTTPFGSFEAPGDGLLRHEKNAYTARALGLRGSGFNGSLAEPACAVGSVQLSRVGEFNRRRTQIADRLDEALGALPWATPQRSYPGAVSSRHLYSFLLDGGVEREQYVQALAGFGVEIQLRYFPLHLLPEWRSVGSAYGDCPVTEDIWFRKLVNLPLYPMLTDQQVDYMIEATERAYRVAAGHESLRASALELSAKFDLSASLLPALT